MPTQTLLYYYTGVFVFLNAPSFRACCFIWEGEDLGVSRGQEEESSIYTASRSCFFHAWYDSIFSDIGDLDLNNLYSKTFVGFKRNSYLRSSQYLSTMILAHHVRDDQWIPDLSTPMVR